jgi:hypothetical protein
MNGSFNGAITTIPFSGEYGVQADCTGDAVIHNGQTAHLKFMLVERGLEANYFITDRGVVAAGQISKIQLERCSTATFRGVFSFSASGSAFGSSGELCDVAVFSRLVVDGHRHGTQTSWSSFNGFQSTENADSTYSVNPDCTGSATILHSTRPAEHVNFVMVERGTEAKFIATTPGNVFTGTLDKQPIDED